MLIVGLTGGIGSGKSTVAALFSELGVPYVDADLVARELVAPGEPLLAAIVDRFGSGVLAADGTLDRRAMRTRIFTDPAARGDLERLLHPAVYREIRRRVTTFNAPYCLLVIPLLVETGALDRVHRVLVVDVDETTQVERTARRDAAEPEQVAAILRSQASREQRLAAADDTIDNRGDGSDLGPQIESLHRRYLALAASRPWPAPFGAES